MSSTKQHQKKILPSLHVVGDVVVDLVQRAFADATFDLHLRKALIFLIPKEYLDKITHFDLSI